MSSALLLVAGVCLFQLFLASPRPRPLVPVQTDPTPSGPERPAEKSSLPEHLSTTFDAKLDRLDHPLAAAPEFVVDVVDNEFPAGAELDPWGVPYTQRYLRVSSDAEWDRLLLGREEHVMARSSDGSHEVKWTRAGVYLISPDGRERISYSPHEANWALFSANGRWVALRIGKRFIVWNVARRSMHLWGNGGRFCFSPNSRYFLFGQTPGTTRIHDLETDLQLVELAGALPEQPVDYSKANIFSEDGTRLLTVEPGKAWVHEMPGGKMLCELRLPAGSVHCFDRGYLTAKGDRAVLSGKEQVSVWDVLSGKRLPIDPPAETPGH